MSLEVLRRAAAGVLSLVVTGALGVVGLSAPAHAETTYRIDSVAGCQAFLDAFVGAPPAGTVTPGHCAVAGSETGPGEVHLPAGDRLVIARGWELSFDSVLFFDEGVTVNYGSLRSRDDVVNVVGSAVLVNKGTITIVRGSALGVSDDAAVLNAGRIVLACGGGTNGTITGNAPVSIADCDEAPWVTATRPAAGARAVPVTAAITLWFSERVGWTPGWYDVRCSTSGRHWAATRRGGGTALVLVPTRRFAAGEWCSVTIHAGLVADGDFDLPATMGSDFRFGFRTAS
ncbi:MAG: Ig-like domain-containing protein [Nocardioidaceae bacterium]